MRRRFIPAAPTTQAELDINLDWFLVNHDPKESLVKGDILHSDGLRVLLFSSDESLNILARLRLFYVMEHSGYVLISGIKCLSSVLNLEIILLFLFVLVFFQIKKEDHMMIFLIF